MCKKRLTTKANYILKYVDYNYILGNNIYLKEEKKLSYFNCYGLCIIHL